MRTPRWTWFVAVLIALALNGCTRDSDPNVHDVGPEDFSPWSTMAELAEKESITVAVLGDQVDDKGAPIGFEVEVAEMIAGALGIDAHDIVWMQTTSGDRERLIEDGHADIVVAAFGWNATSLEIVDFAGPYYVGELRLVVRAGVDEVSGSRVCTTADVVESPPEELSEATVVSGTATDCIELLHQGDVAGVFAEDLALLGIVSEDFVIMDRPRAEQRYGVGLRKGNDELRALVNDVLERASEDGRWDAAWESTAEQVLGPAEPPPIDRY